jgi:hypothetical protein
MYRGGGGEDESEIKMEREAAMVDTPDGAETMQSNQRIVI